MSDLPSLLFITFFRPRKSQFFHFVKHFFWHHLCFKETYYGTVCFQPVFVLFLFCFGFLSRVLYKHRFCCVSLPFFSSASLITSSLNIHDFFFCIFFPSTVPDDLFKVSLISFHSSLCNISTGSFLQYLIHRFIAF